MIYHDMVLKDHPAHEPIGCGCQVLAVAQHEADMAHEVACPVLLWSIGEGLFSPDSPRCWAKCVCGGTGRVTLGAIVAADRAWTAARLADGKAREEAAARGSGTTAAEIGNHVL